MPSPSSAHVVPEAADLRSQIASASLSLHDGADRAVGTIRNAIGYVDQALTASVVAVTRAAAEAGSESTATRSQRRALAAKLAAVIADVQLVVADDVLALDDVVSTLLADLQTMIKVLRKRGAPVPDAMLSLVKAAEADVERATDHYIILKCRLEDVANASLVQPPPTSPSAMSFASARRSNSTGTGNAELDDEYSPAYPSPVVSLAVSRTSSFSSTTATAAGPRPIAVPISSASLSANPSTTYLSKLPPQIVRLAELQSRLRATSEAMARLSNVVARAPSRAEPLIPLGLPFSRTNSSTGSSKSPSLSRSSVSFSRRMSLSFAPATPRSASPASNADSDDLASARSHSSSLAKSLGRSLHKISDAIKRVTLSSPPPEPFHVPRAQSPPPSSA
ncbi:hypothetical protein H9P43_004732 [Blastocladiella emersonii ATCC 22665]|nr:hypothetical protein H9P43_004732 [Blastocladiella emersonii ATCC 22665]